MAMAIEIKTKALDLALSQIEKQFGKGSIMKLGEQAIVADVPVDLDRLARSRPRARRRRAAARPRDRNLRPGIIGQNHAGARMLSPRRKRRAASAPSSMPSTRSMPAMRASSASTSTTCCISQPDNGEQALEIAETLVRIRRGRCDRDRLGGGAGAARRNRRRDGRSADGLAGAPDVAGAAQADRDHLALATPSSSSSTRSA